MKPEESSTTLQKLQVLPIIDEPIRFINTYEGMPVNQAGEIIDSEAGSVRVKTSKTQLLALEGKTETYFEIDITSAFYKARIKSIDWHASVVELTDFEAVAIPLGLRSAVRINTSGIAVTFLQANRKKPYEAQLIDLSLVGIAIKIAKSSSRLHVPITGDVLQINYDLPIEVEGDETRQRISCQGMIIYSLFDQDGAYFRLGIETSLDQTQEQYINHFILQHQIKLIQQIRDLSEHSDDQFNLKG
jgi:RNase P/RNase MRP subunit p29